MAEVELLQDDSDSLPEDARESVASLSHLATRIQQLVDRVAAIEQPERVEYMDGPWMTDLSKR